MKKEVCNYCGDTGQIAVKTIAGKMLDYCPFCNFLDSGKSYKQYIKEYNSRRGIPEEILTEFYGRNPKNNTYEKTQKEAHGY